LDCHSQQGQEIFLFSVASHPPAQWISGVPFSGIKQPRHEADQSLLSVAIYMELHPYSNIHLYGIIFNYAQRNIAALTSISE
jgi:hypothetical protein